MEGFFYSNIFETKGLEYILTIIFFALLIPFWLILNNRAAIKRGIQRALGVLSPARLNIPEGILHSQNHTWLYLFKSGTARVGADDLLMRIMGEVTLQPLKNPGEFVMLGEPIALMNQQDKQIKIVSPLSGTLHKFNPETEKDNTIMFSDPFGKGWMFEIKPSNWINETQFCYIAEDAKAWESNELVRFKDFLSNSLSDQKDMPSMLVLQDGGELREHLLNELPQEVWSKFEGDFLNEKLFTKKVL